MKTNPITIIIISILLALMLTLTIKTASAEEVEIIDIVMIPTPTPTPPPDPPIETHSYEHDRDDLETLARLLWSSPLRAEDAKKTLLWVVLNRVSDQSGMFGDSIATVVTKGEFTFFDSKAHLSETNLRISQEVMDEWVSEDHGFYVGRHVPANGLYIRFVGENNRGIEVTSWRGGVALAW